ncbi:conjugative relaxase [Opitutaceae bacterium TAV4]|nr:conjugative relaxase [Opitutaceae bacterium TAV4]
MLTSKPQLNLKNAKGYFREHLGVGDYYMQGHVVVGEWRGVAAQMLGLNGKVTEDQFLKMCDGLHPETGQKLTMRKNTTRREAGRNVSNRRVFYDFTISPPKSVSVVALMQDARIVAAHDRAARKMVDEMEKFAETRVRRGGANGERVTGAVAAALFRHDTSRELDPHLHTHCVLFNATFDGVEGQWKALHASGMYRAQKFAENVYYHELARELVSLGYQIKNHSKGFEIEGVPVSVIETFSKRHWQIEEETRHRIRVEGLKGNEKALREQVAQDSRRRKIRNAVVEKLRPGWEMEMNETERWVVQALSGKLEPKPQDRAIVPGREVPALVEWADKHVFERKSVVADYELWSEALARGRGENFEVETVKQTVAERGYIRDRETGKLTTLEVLRRELFLVEAVNAGRRKYRALNADYKPAASLSEEQSRAVKQILGSRDLVTLFQGGAGTGKSHTLAQVVRGLEAANHPVVVLAPQNQQAADLRKDGLGEAQTVARALAAKVPLPRSAVVIVDEAGQIGAADMGKLVRQVREVEGRLILSGDTRQHGAVAASDALRAIEQYSDVKPVRLETIRRQDPERMRTVEQKKFVTKYREAVQAAAAGDLGKSFRLLDEMGCIQELDTEECYQKLAKAYCEAVSGDRPQKVLAVAQTWAEVREANAAIRQKLQEVKKLGRGVTVTAWQPSGLTEAQKRDARFLCKFQSGPDAGMGAYFVRDYGRFKKGDLCEIAGLGEQGVLLRKEGLVTEVSHEYAERFVVAESHSVEVATGERLLMKFNGKSVEGRAIRNGDLVTVKKVLSDGRIRVTGEDGKRKTLSAGQRMFVPGYAVTSYASQGKTVDTVLLAHANGETLVNRQQWYVGISRARGKIAVFTGDKEALRMHLEQASGNRELALSINPDEQSIEAARQLNQRLEEAFQHDLCVNSWQQHQSLHESVDLRQEVAVATEIAHGIEPAASIEPAVELGIEPSAAPVVAPAIKPEQKPEAAEVSEKISQQVWWQIHQHIAQQNNYHQSRGRGIRL